MNNIKYRQLVGSKWHYWGYINHSESGKPEFTGPIKTLDGSFIESNQFTGLTDKNGVEIYDGDILISDFFSGNLEVYYCTDIASFVFKSNRLNGGFAGFHQYDSKNFDVIGNIYQKPELLK